MKKNLVILISLIIAYAITILSRLKDNNAILLFGIINSIFIWLGMFLF